MSVVHFLNVGNGDCSIIQHDSGRISVIDIYNGNMPLTLLGKALYETKVNKTNYGMRKSPTNPIHYMKNICIKTIFRFILTHPDMDHMDGFKRLCDEIGIQNFWDSGVRKAKPDFSEGHYKEEDWDHYVKVREGRCDVNVVAPREGSQFQYANKGYPGDHGDCLDIVAPNQDLINLANWSDDTNIGSYVLVFRTCGGKIIFPGDALDETWEFILNNHSDKVADCKVLIAPHHGRDSGCSFEFLKVLKPKLTLFGCADSKNLAYDKWNKLSLFHITNNQAGNIILKDVNNSIEVFVENQRFAQKFSAYNESYKLNNCYFIGRV